MLSATLEGINIFTPTLKIEKDTEDERKYDWFEPIPQNGGQYYAERIKLKATTVYPKVRPGVSPAPIHNGNLTAHPLAGFKVKNYNETAILSEVQKALFLRIYDGLRGATKLPKKDIKFNNGIAKFHLDSVSYAKILHTKPMVSVHMIQDNDYKPAYELEDFDVEQWITISKVDVTGNGGWNNSDVPDWLEKKVWDIINNAKGLGGVIGESFTYVQDVGLIEEEKVCGGVWSNDDMKLLVNPFCVGNTKYAFRIDDDNALKGTVYHEARHTWQYNMAKKFEDADNDYIPKAHNGIGVVFEPFIDGNNKTQGDSINDNPKITDIDLECPITLADEKKYYLTCDAGYLNGQDFGELKTFSSFFRENDASRFECMFALNSGGCL